MSHIRHKQFTRTKKKAFSSKPRWWPIRPSISSVHVLFCCCQHLQFHLVLIKTQPWKGYEALFGISSAIWLMFSAPTHSWQSRGNRVTGLKCFITTEAYPQYSCSADHCRAGLHYHVYHLSDPKTPPLTPVFNSSVQENLTLSATIFSWEMKSVSFLSLQFTRVIIRHYSQGLETF